RALLDFFRHDHQHHQVLLLAAAPLEPLDHLVGHRELHVGITLVVLPGALDEELLDRNHRHLLGVLVQRVEQGLHGVLHRTSRKYWIVLSSPSLSDTFGSQPRSVRASVMSGCRVCGSSTGSGLNTIGLRLPTASRIVSANSRMVISWGLPMLTGVAASLLSRRQIPSTRSETKQNERVCFPSPNTVIGSPASAWGMNAGTTRPSRTRIRGP